MARRLKGREFVTNDWNGVTALAERDVLLDSSHAPFMAGLAGVWWKTSPSSERSPKDMQRVAKRGMIHLSTPIFTFTDGNRIKNSQPWFTGDTLFLEMLIEYIKKEGGKILGPDIALFVPFSNGHEMGNRGLEEAEQEFHYVTSRRQFRETFGISYDELMAAVTAFVG